MKKPTRQRLVEAAICRFYRDEFRSVGISKTAFYKHFESKEELMLAALEMQNSWLQETFRAMVRERGGPTAICRLRALFDVVDTIIESDDFQDRLFVNAAMELSLSHEPAHVSASQNKQAIEDIVHPLTLEAGANESRAFAQQLCLIMEGTYVTRHVTGSTQTIDIARGIAELVIRACCPNLSTTLTPDSSRP